MTYKMFYWYNVENRMPTDFGKYLVLFEDGAADAVEFWSPDHWSCTRKVVWWAEIKPPTFD